MITKEDVNKMSVKPTKKPDNSVYGKGKNGVVDFHEFDKFYVNNEKLSVVISRLEKKQKEIKDSLDELKKLLKEVLKNHQDRLENLEGVAKLYGNID